jgi:hypothetical protein
LLRRARDGKYRVAIMNGNVAFDGQLLSSDSAIGISAVAVDGVDTLLAAGPTGLYRVQPGRIDPLVSSRSMLRSARQYGYRPVMGSKTRRHRFRSALARRQFLLFRGASLTLVARHSNPVDWNCGH